MKIFTFLLLFIAHICFGETLPERMEQVLVGGHRSGSRYIAETNLKDIKKSLAAGVDILEMDLRLTRDNKVIVFHNSSLLGKTTCPYDVTELSYDKIKGCRLLNGQKILLFEDVLKFVDARAIVNAEFKVIEVIPYALEILKKYNAYEWVYFQNQSDKEKYQLARSLDPYVYLHFAIKSEEDLIWFINQRDERFVIGELSLKMQSKENIALLQGAGKKVSTNTWRVDRFSERFKARCKQFIQMGFDIVTTNYVKSCIVQRNDLFLPAH